MLVTGGSGQLGTAFRSLVRNASFPTRHELDLSDPSGVAASLSAARPSSIVNCAAFTAVDRAEDEEELATVVNGDSVGVMATYAATAEIPFVTFSTDYVFPGDASEPYLESAGTDPINAYGRSKLVGEKLALAAHEEALVVRTSWVISGTHPNFVASMLRQANDGELLVVDDQLGRPTVADDLARATVTALTAGVTGIVHLANEGAITWFGLARAAVEMGGRDPDRVRPCRTSDYPSRAPRPGYSVLGTERSGESGVTELPHWRESLPGVVKRLVTA